VKEHRTPPTRLGRPREATGPWRGKKARAVFKETREIGNRAPEPPVIPVQRERGETQTNTCGLLGGRDDTEGARRCHEKAKHKKTRRTGAGEEHSLKTWRKKSGPLGVTHKMWMDFKDCRLLGKHSLICTKVVGVDAGGSYKELCGPQT